MTPSAWRTEQRAALLDEIPSGLVVIDRDYAIVDHNRSFGDMFGSARGRPCYQVLKGRSDRCPVCSAEKTFTDGRQRVLEESGRDRSGQPAHFLVQVTPLTDGDRVTHVAAITTDLTATRRLQREYQTLFERVPCYVAVLNREFRVVKANERFREVFGEPTGEHCWTLLKKRSEACPDCPAQKTFADGGSHTSRHVGVALDGSATFYQVSTAPLARSNGEVNHVVEMALDVTETHDLEEELSREAVLRRALVEHAVDAIVILDDRKRVVMLNRSAEVLWGQSRDALVGRRMPKCAVPLPLDRLLSGDGEGTVVRDTAIRAAGGERIPVRLAAVRLPHGDESLGVALIAQDLREVRQLERDKLDAERLAAVGQTVAGLAHGIKNILTGLEGGMYVTSSGLKKGDDGRIEQGWGMLERNMERISTLVKNLLAFSRGDTPKIREVDPEAVVREVVDLYRDSADQHGVTLAMLDAGPVAPAPMDPEGLHACVANLVSNALDACLVSHRTTCTVEVSVADRGGTIVIEVSDGGCGMDYEVKQKAFTSFFTTKGSGGTGLGLLITRKIVQQHGGSITFESTPGTGTTFRLTFPRDRLPRQERTEDDDDR